MINTKAKFQQIKVYYRSPQVEKRKNIATLPRVKSSPRELKSF